MKQNVTNAQLTLSLRPDEASIHVFDTVILFFFLSTVKMHGHHTELSYLLFFSSKCVKLFLPFSDVIGKMIDENNFRVTFFRA